MLVLFKTCVISNFGIIDKLECEQAEKWNPELDFRNIELHNHLRLSLSLCGIIHVTFISEDLFINFLNNLFQFLRL